MSIPPVVALWTIAPVVRFPVHFDGEPGFEAREIEGVGSERKLPTEPEASRPLAKLLPKPPLGRAHLASQPTRSLDGLDHCPQHGGAPSTTPLRVAVPLPVPGRSFEAHPSPFLPGTGRGTMRSIVEGARVHQIRPLTAGTLSTPS